MIAPNPAHLEAGFCYNGGMLTQRHRFHGYGSLRYVYKNGQVTRSSLITVKYSINSRRKSSRFAVVISKKIFKSAVKRNRVRRRVYEVIRQELPLLRGSCDVVVMIFSPEILAMESSALKQLIKQLFSQSGLYK